MQQGVVRIIGGKWRGRRLKVPTVAGLRPTPDRVRETLFNWLSEILPGAVCLDLFAGSGALGFEALSRGASHVVMVDQSMQVINALNEAKKMLHADQLEIYQAAVPNGLKKPATPYDVVFLDPPYDADLLLPCCRFLEENDFLADFATIYLEARETIKDNDLPSNWHLVKCKQAGQVVYHLVKREKGLS